MFGLVVGEGARQGEAPCLGACVGAAGQVEIHRVRGAEGRVSLDDEDGVTADDDRELVPGQSRHARRPEAGGIDDDGRVDVVARGRGHAGHPSARLADGDHLHALLDDGAALPRRLGIARRHRGWVAVARARLPEQRAEPGGVDTRLDAGEVGGLDDLGADAQGALEGERLLERRPHRWRDADEDAGADEAGGSTHRVREPLEDGERAKHHLARFPRGIQLANNPDGAAGAARADERLLEDEHPPEAQPGELEGGGDAGDPAADDDGVDDARRHGRRRTGSPRRIAPVRSTRA